VTKNENYLVIQRN